MRKKNPIIQYFTIANIITSLGIVFGFISLILIINKYTRLGLTVYCLVLIFDRIDGVIARRLKQTSEFGIQLDSLADALNFGFIPAITAYMLGFNSCLMVLALTFYILCSVWRLACYNIIGMEKEAGENYFVGLPTTLIGAVFLIFLSFHPLMPETIFIYSMSVFFIFSSLSMISSLRYSKNGIITKGITLVGPILVIMMWFY